MAFRRLSQGEMFFNCFIQATATQIESVRQLEKEKYWMPSFFSELNAGYRTASIDERLRSLIQSLRGRAERV
jgi:hypothetical protein